MIIVHLQIQVLQSSEGTPNRRQMRSPLPIPTRTSSEHYSSSQSSTYQCRAVPTKQSNYSEASVYSHSAILLTSSYRDLSTRTSPEFLNCIGSISAHTRPVEALDTYITPYDTSAPTAVLFTADTMGVIKVRNPEKQTGADGKPSIRPRPASDDLKYHRTRINQIVYGDGHVWSGRPPSSKDLILPHRSRRPKHRPTKPSRSIHIHQ